MPCPPFRSAHRVSCSGLCRSGTDPFSMESWGHRFELILNEMRMLGVTPTPNAWRPAECEGSIRIIICGGQRRGKSGWKKGLSDLSFRSVVLSWFKCLFGLAGVGVGVVGGCYVGLKRSSRDPLGSAKFMWVLILFFSFKVSLSSYSRIYFIISVWGPLYLPPEVRCIFEEYETTSFNFPQNK